MLNWLSSLPPALIYVVVGLLVFAEDALFVGFVLPGETAAVIGGVLANRGTVSIWGLSAVVVFAAIAGDSVGFEVGRHYGDRLLDTRPLRGHQVRLAKARELIRRRGAEAVFLGRFVSFFRALMPPLAAISHLPYRRFLLFNALGGVVWGVGFTLLGYFAGAAYSRVEHLVGGILAGVVALIVIVALIMWQVRRHRAESAEEEAGGAEEPEARRDADAEPEPGAGAGAEREGQSQPEPESRRDADAEPEPEPGAGAGAERERQSQPEPESRRDADAEPEPEPGAGAEPEARRSVDAGTDAEPQSQPQQDADHESGGDITR